MNARFIKDIAAKDHQKGDIEYRGQPDIGEPGGYAYRCPGCGDADYFEISVDGARGLKWNGSNREPTIEQPIAHRCGWRGFLSAGKWVKA